MADFKKRDQEPGSDALREFVSLELDRATVIFKGALGPASRYVFDRVYTQVEKKFPTTIIIDTTKLSGFEDKGGLNALTNFVLSLRQKRNSLRYVGLRLPVYRCLEALGLAYKEELGLLPDPAGKSGPAASSNRREEYAAPPPRPAKKSGGSGRAKTKTIKMGGQTGISIAHIEQSSLVLEGKTKPSLAPASPSHPREVAAKPPSLLSIFGQREVQIPASFWRAVGENPNLILAKHEGLADEAEVSFFSKDRTHALLIDSNIQDEKFERKHQFLYARQLGRCAIDKDFPLKTATLIFALPENSPLRPKLLAKFTENYRMPRANPLQDTMACEIQGQGSRQAKNIVIYPLAIAYKAKKVEIRLTVKVLELTSAMLG